jgi:hypothetical protein
MNDSQGMARARQHCTGQIATRCPKLLHRQNVTVGKIIT